MKKLLLILILINSLAFGQKKNPRLFEFKASTCDKYEDTDRLRTRIIHKKFNKDTLTIYIASTATCCVDFIPKVTVSRDSINLDFEEGGNPCECGCCYEFTYRILKVKNSNPKISFKGKEIEQSNEKYKTYPIKFEIVNGDTVNYVDKYGMRQGKFVSAKEIGSEKYIVFLDDIPTKHVQLFPSGSIRSITSREKMRRALDDGRILTDFSHYNYFVEYYSSGAKKLECHSLNSNDLYRENGHCKEWDENQILIYEGSYKKEK